MHLSPSVADVADAQNPTKTEVFSLGIAQNAAFTGVFALLSRENFANSSISLRIPSGAVR